ncbi:MAG: hypothetical protein AUI47_08425 [Acidobacteria bacterium 13_1_40CM_2_68_5]|nr:MAG: hypothetical protein AUI47_08425 [Acidobacteria bacterium 13_1_40CM_2_68_5]
MKAGLGLLTVCLFSGLSAAPALGSPAITHLTAERNGETYQAACRLEGALTPDVEEEISAGLPTSIEYRLNLYRRRTAFFDQLVLKRRIECTARYDTLTKQYTLTRRLDGELQDTRVTDDAAVMRGFMTELHGVPIVKADDLQPGETYYLKAKSNLGLVWRFYLIPWPMDTDWERVELTRPGGKSVATQP